MDSAILVLWSLAGAGIPALWAPSLKEYRWLINIPCGSVISCAATIGLCEWKGIIGFGERNAIAFGFGVVGVAITKNVLDLCRSDGFKQWVADRLGIKQPHKPTPHSEPDSDPNI